MSLLSLGRMKEASGEESLEKCALSQLARTHFRLVSPPQYSRKEPRQPLLKLTPDDEKETVSNIWHVMMKYCGDINNSIPPDQHSNEGKLSIICRLSKQWGMFRSGDTAKKETKQDTDDSLPTMKVLPNRPRGGTLNKLRTNLTLKLFGKAPNFDATLPVEETLQTSLEEIQYIASCGILKPQLRDEIYCLMCKQITRNPSKNSVNKLWMLLTLVIGCFPPSEMICPTILSFMNEQSPPKLGMLKRLMKKSRENGARFQPPSVMEKSAKKPIELQITLMDGTVQTVTADGATTAVDVCTALNDALGLVHIFGYSIYIALNNKVVSLGSSGHHIMDAVAQCEQKTKKKKVPTATLR